MDVMCCSCWPLRTVSLIFGYIKAVVYSLIIIYGATLAAGVGVGDDATAKSVGSVLGGILIVVAAINLIFAAFLLVGAHTNNPSHLQKYIIFTYVNLVLGGMSFVMNPSQGITMLPSIVFEIFSVFVVRSHKMELESEPAKYNVMINV